MRRQQEAEEDVMAQEPLLGHAIGTDHDERGCRPRRYVHLGTRRADAGDEIKAFT